MTKIKNNRYFMNSDELAALILHAKGDKKTLEKLKREWGKDAFRIAELNTHFAEVTSICPPLPHPPKYFISYRWESIELKRWVKKFASGLESRGCQVILDQFENEDTGHVDVAKLVSKMGKCNYLLIIVTPEYLEGIKYFIGIPNWVFYEFENGVRLKAYDRLEIIAILRDDVSQINLGLNCDILDFRDDKTFDRQLNRYFRYDGPVFTDSSPASQIWQEGWKLLAASLFEDAELLFRKATRLYPSVPLFWNHLGFTYSQLNKVVDAEKALDDAYKLEKNNLFTIGLLAEIAYRKRDYKTAIEFVTFLLSKNPWDSRAHFVIGNICDDRGEYQKALHHFEIFLKQKPKNVNGLNDCGMVYLHLKDYSQAIKMFNKALEFSPDFLLARINKANALRLQGNIHSAINECEGIIKINPNYEEAYKMLKFLKSQK